MVDTPTTQDPQLSYIDELRAEGTNLSGDEKAAHDAMVEELAGELALSESIRRQTAEDIEQARSLAHSSKSRETGEVTRSRFPLDFAQIGWLSEKEAQPIEVERVESRGLIYYFASIVGLDNIASKAMEHLNKEGTSAKLLSALRGEYIPGLWSDIIHGRGKSRPLSFGGGKRGADRSLNTTLPAYKIDVQGTNNRGIVLVPGRIDGAPVMVLAALFDHEDQPSILGHMGLGKRRK